MRRGVQRLWIGVRQLEELAVNVADLVHRLLALGLAGLDHERLVDDEREVHRGRVQAEVEHSLGKVERGNARLLVQVDQRHDELVHTDLVIRHGEGILEPDAHIVRVQHGVHRRLADAGLAEREHVGQRAHDDVEVAVEHLHAADGFFGILEAVLAVLFDDQLSL